MIGVTSMCRFWLGDERSYHSLLHFFRSKAYSTPAHKFVDTSNCQRLARVGPLERFRHGGVEVLDEVNQPLV